MISCLQNLESAGRVGRSPLRILPTVRLVRSNRNTWDRRPRIAVRIRDILASVVFREDTARGTEIFPVFVGDRGIGSDAENLRSPFTDLLFPTQVGVDDDEHSFTFVVADADFEVVVDRVVVDDVVHVWFPLGPVSRPRWDMYIIPYSGRNATH